MSKIVLLAAAAVGEMISRVLAQGAAYVEEVQAAATQCIGHAVQHGDVTLASRLLAAVRPHHKAALVTFFEVNGPFRYRKESGDFEKNREWKGNFDPDTLPYWEKAKAPQKIVSIFDVDEAFDRWLKVAKAQTAKAKSVKNKDLIEVLEAAQAAFSFNREARSAANAVALLKAEVEMAEELEAASPKLGKLKVA